MYVCVCVCACPGAAALVLSFYLHTTLHRYHRQSERKKEREIDFCREKLEEENISLITLTDIGSISHR